MNDEKILLAKKEYVKLLEEKEELLKLLKTSQQQVDNETLKYASDVINNDPRMLSKEDMLKIAFTKAVNLVDNSKRIYVLKQISFKDGGTTEPWFAYIELENEFSVVVRIGEEQSKDFEHRNQVLKFTDGFSMKKYYKLQKIYFESLLNMNINKSKFFRKIDEVKIIKKLRKNL